MVHLPLAEVARAANRFQGAQPHTTEWATSGARETEERLATGDWRLALSVPRQGTSRIRGRIAGQGARKANVAERDYTPSRFFIL